MLMYFLFALLCLMLSVFQFREKGILLNNAFLYASPKERDQMDRKPYYHQSAIVFLLLGIRFVLLGLNVIFEKNWLSFLSRFFLASVLVYAVVSTVVLWRMKK